VHAFMPDNDVPVGISREKLLIGPNRMIQILHGWKSESALWQSFCQATAQRVEHRDLLPPLAAGRLGSKRKF
jgi:hypothetical protein